MFWIVKVWRKVLSDRWDEENPIIFSVCKPEDCVAGPYKTEQEAYSWFGIS